MLPWTLKLNCKPYIPYALLVYDLFSVEKTARVLKLVVEHWSFASCSHSSMFIKPVLVFSGALCFPSVWNLLLPAQLIPSFSEEFVKAGIWIPLEGLCSALQGLLQLVHLAVTGWVSQLKAPALILVYKTGKESRNSPSPPRGWVFCSFDVQLHCSGAEKFQVFS